MATLTDENKEIFSKIKRIPPFAKNIVYGYIRLQIIKNQYDNIPELIFFICLIYYYQFDIFGKHSKNLIILGDAKNIITKTKGRPQWDPIYGIEWFESNKNNIIKWTVKLIDGNYNVAVAIVSNKHHLEIDQDIRWPYSYVYYFHNLRSIDGNTESKHSKIKIVKGDKVTFILDFTSSTLEVIKNDNEDNDIIFTNIRKGNDIKYKIALQIHYTGTSVQFIDRPHIDYQ